MSDCKLDMLFRNWFATGLSEGIILGLGNDVDSRLANSFEDCHDFGGRLISLLEVHELGSLIVERYAGCLRQLILGLGREVLLGGQVARVLRRVRTGLPRKLAVKSDVGLAIHQVGRIGRIGDIGQF